MSGTTEVTHLLIRWSEGEESTMDELVPLVYDELRRLAHLRLRAERADHTFHTTALVHEAYLRLVNINRIKWRDRAHFMAMASRTMRRVLVDCAHRRNAVKRGGDVVTVPLDGEPAVPDGYLASFMDLNEALTKLEEANPRAARIIEQRYFGGLTLEETAAVMEVSLATVKRDLRLARAWLARELRPNALLRDSEEEVS